MASDNKGSGKGVRGGVQKTAQEALFCKEAANISALSSNIANSDARQQTPLLNRIYRTRHTLITHVLTTILQSIPCSESQDIQFINLGGGLDPHYASQLPLLCRVPIGSQAALSTLSNQWTDS